MTWTEGVVQISDTISIHGGYLGIISAIGIVLICLAVIALYTMGIYALIDEFNRD